jgi:hypothetical protein
LQLIEVVLDGASAQRHKLRISAHELSVRKPSCRKLAKVAQACTCWFERITIVSQGFWLEQQCAAAIFHQHLTVSCAYFFRVFHHGLNMLYHCRNKSCVLYEFQDTPIIHLFNSQLYHKYIRHTKC